MFLILLVRASLNRVQTSYIPKLWSNSSFCNECYSSENSPLKIILIMWHFLWWKTNSLFNDSQKFSTFTISHLNWTFKYKFDCKCDSLPPQIVGDFKLFQGSIISFFVFLGALLITKMRSRSNVSMNRKQNLGYQTCDMCEFVYTVHKNLSALWWK